MKATIQQRAASGQWVAFITGSLFKLRPLHVKMVKAGRRVRLVVGDSA